MGFLDKLKDFFSVPEPFTKNPVASNLDDDKKFSIGLSMIISEQNMSYSDTLDTGGIDDQKYKMENFWGIVDHDTALEFLSVDSIHSDVFDEALKIFSSKVPVRITEKTLEGTPLEGMGEEGINAVSGVKELFTGGSEEIYNYVGDLVVAKDMTTKAWDYGRLVFVARACYTIGYISEKEAWEIINRITKLAKQNFSNWEDYSKSYILGRGIWDVGGLNDICGIVDSLLDHKDSPWKVLKWN